MDTSIHYTLWKGTLERTNSAECLSSLERILCTAKIDYSTAKKEYDVSEELRCMGDEYTFEAVARKNISLLQQQKISHIITPCAHSYLVFSQYYPAYSGHFTVYHHTDFILELLQKGILPLKNTLSGRKITYHDPCRLSRNGKIDAPRAIISLLGGTICEAKHHGQMSMCCGGGGSLSASDTPMRISQMRMMELEATGADIIVTSCPICRDMLSANAFSQSPKVVDIATLVGMCL